MERTKERKEGGEERRNECEPKNAIGVPNDLE